MKIRLLALSMLLPMLVFCTSPANPDDGENKENPVVNDPSVEPSDDPSEVPVDQPSEDPSQSPAPSDDLPTEVTDGSTILVTNERVESFLANVTYPENDYSETHILDEEYAPTAPGNADKPQTYSIRWTKDPSAGKPTARLWEDDGWSTEFTNLSADDYYFTITNLRPQANYHYEVKAGDKVLTSGSFKTEGRVHQLFFLSKVRNIRDLGGWKTKDGTKTVKYRKIYRGGRLEKSTLNNKGIADIKAEGIKAQLDLRGNSDVLSEPAIAGFDFCAPVIEEGYSTMLRNDQAKVYQCFEFILKCVREEKPVYFHCSLGRDRTGTTAMMILGILGVNEGDISKEYELTQFAPHGWATSDGEKTKMTRKADYDDAAKYIWSLADGGEFADGMQAYLLSIGVTQDEIDEFRSLMLE